MRREINLRGWRREVAISIREELRLVEGLAKCSVLNA